MDTAFRSSLTRRRTGLAAGGLTAFMLGLVKTSNADAKKKKHKHKKKKKGSSSPTCAELCGGKAQYCFERADAPTLCAGATNSPDCDHCESDQDCIGSNGAYCLTRFINSETGQTGSFAHVCGDYPTGVCLTATP